MNQNYLKQVLDYDPESGSFIWKHRDDGPIGFNARWAGKKAGSINSQGRLMVSIDEKLHAAHRLAWLYMKGGFPEGHIDHINGDPLDNRIENLRLVTASENMQNMRRPKSNNQSGYLGVSFDKRYDKYEARITTNGKRLNLGRFDCPKAASEAYLKAKREMHPTCSI